MLHASHEKIRGIFPKCECIEQFDKSTTLCSAMKDGYVSCAGKSSVLLSSYRSSVNFMQTIKEKMSNHAHSIRFCKDKQKKICRTKAVTDICRKFIHKID